MKRTLANAGRVAAGVVILFIAYVTGASLCSWLFPNGPRANRMEMLTDKTGESMVIVIAALFLRRYLLRSFGMALVCLVATELVALAIILCFTGLPVDGMDLHNTARWLYLMTWNVVASYLFGIAIGHWWDTRTACTETPVD